MGLIVYLDETGDHSLEVEDETFPVFAIVMLICDMDVYTDRLVPQVYRLKMDYFGHEGIILHSRDIRRAQDDFKFLRDAAQRQPFYDRINAIMGEDFRLIACAIRKQAHKKRYGVWAENPYDLALTFAMERLVTLLEEAGQTEVCIVAEARGKREDDALKLSFLHTINSGTNFIPARQFKAIQFNLQFVPKSMNIVGTQLADLAAYPFARYVMDPAANNPAYEIVKKRFYTTLTGKRLGCKIFP